MKETKFKQTEVGMIPRDWEVLPIKGLCTKVTDGSHESPKEVDNGYYMPSVKDMTDLGFCFSDCKQISKNDYLKLERNGCRPEKDDVLIAKDGSILKYAFVMDDKLPIVILSSIAILRPNKKKIDSHYFAHYFKKEDFLNKVLSDYKTGTGVPRIVLNNFKEIEIAYPKKIEEQQRIANALSDIDTLIANLEKLIAKKKNIKQGAMQQLLTGRKRLPRFAPAKPTYKQTELGQIPTDWEFVPVSELVKDMADGPFGSNLKKEHYTSDPQARIIQLSNVGENGWEDENTKYTTFEHAKTIARCIVPKEESILVAKMMPAGRAIICPKKEKQYVLGSDVIRITANEKLNSKYFVYASKSDAYLKQILDNTQGSTRQRTSISKLRKILILLPSLAEQTAIANVLSDMDTEIDALEQKLAKMRKIKQGMMQELLTGKIRLV